MASVTNYEANRILASSINGAAYSASSSYMALLTVAGTVSSAGTEVSGGSYARQPLSISAPASGAGSNSSTITFSGMPAATVVAIDVDDAVTAGNRKWFGNLTNSRQTAAGDSLQFPSSSVTASLA